MCAAQKHFKAEIHKNLPVTWDAVPLFAWWMKKNHIKKQFVNRLVSVFKSVRAVYGILQIE